jgi:hypothetical protein
VSVKEEFTERGGSEKEAGNFCGVRSTLVFNEEWKEILRCL